MYLAPGRPQGCALVLSAKRTPPCGGEEDTEGASQRVSHLKVGELLLLVGDGLLHQHTLDTLLHRILLCLKRNTDSVVIGQNHRAGNDV